MSTTSAPTHKSGKLRWQRWRRNPESGRRSESERSITTKEALANNWFILKLAWQIHPQRVVADFAKEGLNQLSRVFYSVIFIKVLLETIDRGASYKSLALFIIGSLMLFMVLNLFHQWYSIRFRPISDTIIYEKLYGMLFSKASEVELNCYEDSEFYNKYMLALKEADTRMQSVLDNVSGILFAVLAAGSVFGVMFSIDRYVGLFAILPIIGDFVFGRRTNQLYYLRNKESVKPYRKMEYVNRVLYLAQYAKEIRLSNIYRVLKNIFNDGYRGIIQVINKYMKRIIIVDFIRNVLTFMLIFQGVLFYGAYLAMIPRTITISEFAVLASAMVTGAWILIGMAQNFVSSFENGSFIQNLQHFLQYEQEITERDDALQPAGVDEIEFRNVSFAYRGADEPAMRNINLQVRKNEKIALVGHNGAGKTTFIKLLMRLYDPTEGTVLVNGVPIQDYKLAPYRELFGAAFQDYQVFAMTIAENVLMREPRNEDDRELVRRSLRMSGVYDKVMSLPRGIDTMLTREFDDEGEMLSGGELQKIAIARVFARDVQVVIMDEPSSALDPIAEYQLYESIAEHCADKTVFFISHRLSSAVFADRIYMFEDGSIIEEGSHSELMQLNGRYAEMFRKQAEKYVENAQEVSR